jgi:hypothetical protein
MTFKVKDGLDIAGILFADGNRNVVASNVTATSAIITNTTGVQSTSTGALQVSGGVGVAGGLFIAGIFTATSKISSTSTSTGAVQISGGIGIADSVYVGNRVGFVNASNISTVYQVYNPVTNSLDTVFG